MPTRRKGGLPYHSYAISRDDAVFWVRDLKRRIVRLLCLIAIETQSSRRGQPSPENDTRYRRFISETGWPPDQILRPPHPSYGRLIRSTSTQDVECSTHLTLQVEKAAYEVTHPAYRAFDVHPNSTSDVGALRIEAIVVHCRKPSAVTFAAASGVEMTHTRTLERSWVSSEIAAKVDWFRGFNSSPVPCYGKLQYQIYML